MKYTRRELDDAVRSVAREDHEAKRDAHVARAAARDRQELDADTLRSVCVGSGIDEKRVRAHIARHRKERDAWRARMSTAYTAVRCVFALGAFIAVLTFVSASAVTSHRRNLAQRIRADFASLQIAEREYAATLAAVPPNPRDDSWMLAVHNRIERVRDLRAAYVSARAEYAYATRSRAGRIGHWLFRDTYSVDLDP